MRSLKRLYGLFLLPALFSISIPSVFSQERTESLQEEIFYEAPVRAVDVFDDSLLELPPEVLTKLPEPPVVLWESFESSLLQDWERERVGNDASVLVELSKQYASEGSQSLLVHAPSPAPIPKFTRSVKLKPKTAYRLTARIRTEELILRSSGGGASIELSELQKDGRTGIVEHQHLPRFLGTTDGWQEVEYRFQTSEATAFVRIVLEGASGVAGGRAFFDEVRLLEIPPIVDFLQRDAMISQTRSAPHALVKQLQIETHDERPAILAPIPTRWRLPLSVGKGDFLRMQLIVRPGKGARENKSVCFKIEWTEEGEDRDPEKATFYDQCLLPDLRTTRLLEQSLDLEQFQGLRGTLSFTTYGEADAVPLWGNPRVLARERREGDERPNIVVIVVDTLRADHLGYDGYERSTSPLLDKLAEKAVVYRRAYSTSPWTAPSLTSLFTGRYPSQHHGGIRIERPQRAWQPRRPQAAADVQGGWENRVLGGLFRQATSLKYHPITPENPTFAERLRAAGYDAFGLHSNFNSSGALGLSRGFDRYQMYFDYTGAEKGVHLAREFLDERRSNGQETPFLLFLHTQDPHIPYRLRRELSESFGPSPIGFGTGQKDDAFRMAGRSDLVEFWDWQRLRSGRAVDFIDTVVRFYDSEIFWADRALGKLLKSLEAFPNTVVVVTADHGEEFGEHGEYEHGHSLYDELVRVPLLIRLPGDRHGGTVVEEPVSAIDIAPTILDLVDLEPLPKPEGHSLFSVGTARERHRGGFFTEAMLRGPERTALIGQRYKYIFSHPVGYFFPFAPDARLMAGSTENVGREELYDILEDPGETRDLAQARPRILDEMRTRTALFNAETEHGLHMRCRMPRGLQLRVAAGDTLAHLLPMALREDDKVEIGAERRGFTLRTTPGTRRQDPWWIVRTFTETRPEAMKFTIRAEGDSRRLRFFAGREGKALKGPSLRLTLGDAVLAGSPGEPLDDPGPWCQIWEIESAAPASSEALDSETVEHLRDLGYL